MKINKELLKGSTSLLVLRLLETENMYGYEMIEVLRQRSQNVFELKAGTLYPLLHSLEEKNLLNAYEKEISGKVRKYYSITKEGRKALGRKEEEWKEYSEAVAKVLACGV